MNLDEALNANVPGDAPASPWVAKNGPLLGTLLTHPDEVSGTSVFSDGIKIFWTEGYSNCIVLYPDGRQETVDSHSNHPMIVKEREFENSPNRDQRDMNRAELDEWERMMGRTGDYDSGQDEDGEPVPHIPRS